MAFGKRPNVVWILADQMRAHAMSHRGDPNVRTPHLDLLALEGVEFAGAVSGAPVCTPFRGALLTGLYPNQSGIRANGDALPVQQRTIAHAFVEAGYRTCWIGKWHLDGRRPRGAPEADPALVQYVPPERRGGFQDWYAYENHNQPFHAGVCTDVDGEPRAIALPGYETDALTDLWIEWLYRHRAQRGAQPFFSVLSVQPPHPPYVAPAENLRDHPAAHLQLRPNVPVLARVRDRVARELPGYCAAIERLDANVGRVRAALQACGMTDDTYILFFSDHGDLHGSHGLFRKSAPWEEAVRIPCLLAGGAVRTRANARRVSCAINHVDLAPTTLGLCGLPAPPGMPGRDYAPVARGEDGAAEAAPGSALLGLYAPSRVGYGMDREFRGVVTTDGWKYVVLEHQSWLLFHLADDPYELANLVFEREFQSRRDALHAQLAQWLRRTGDDFALSTGCVPAP